MAFAAAATFGFVTVSENAAVGEGAVRLAQQQVDLPYLTVAPTIVAFPGTENNLPIRVGPVEALPPKTFLSLRGLPPTIGLTEGQSIGPGSWTIPVSALPQTKAIVPEGLSAQSEVVVSLIGMDGKLIAQVKSTLIVGFAVRAAPAAELSAVPDKGATSGALPTTKERSEAAPSSPPPPIEVAAADKVRAQELVAQGDRYLAEGKVASARLFFRQAADANFATAAMRLAATYDPNELAALKVLGVSPDLAEARKWYERARALGAPEADRRLAGLPRN